MKLRYKLTRRGLLKHGDIVVLLHYRLVPQHYIIQGEGREDSCVLNALTFDLIQADTPYIKRDFYMLEDDLVGVLAPDLAHMVCRSAEEARLALSKWWNDVDQDEDEDDEDGV